MDDGESGKAYHETDSIVSDPCSGKVFSPKCLNNVREVRVSIRREWLINGPCSITQVGYELVLPVFEVTAMVFEWKVTVHVGRFCWFFSFDWKQRVRGLNLGLQSDPHLRRTALLVKMCDRQVIAYLSRSR